MNENCEARSIEDLLPHYAYPGEIEAYAKVARCFLPEKRMSDVGALDGALDPLIRGLEEAGYGQVTDATELFWHPVLDLAMEALLYPAETMAAWREFMQLPAEERQNVLKAARK